MTSFHPISLSIAVGGGLLLLWLVSGLTTALLAAALADLTLSAVEVRRRRTELQREQR